MAPVLCSLSKKYIYFQRTWPNGTACDLSIYFSIVRFFYGFENVARRYKYHRLSFIGINGLGTKIKDCNFVGDFNERTPTLHLKVFCNSKEKFQRKIGFGSSTQWIFHGKNRSVTIEKGILSFFCVSS